MITQQQTRFALLIGTALILMAIVAGIAFGGLFPQLYVAGDAGKTYQNLQLNYSLLNCFIFCLSVVCILDGLVAWWLFRFAQSIDQYLAGLIAMLRIVYTFFLLAAMGHLISLHFQPSTAVDTYTAFSRFLQIWSAGLIIFGTHLLLWGYLFIRYQPKAKLAGALLMLGGIAYEVVHGLRTVSSMQELSHQLEAVFALPMAIGELYVAVWLLYQGIKSLRVSRKSVS